MRGAARLVLVLLVAVSAACGRSAPSSSVQSSSGPSSSAPSSNVPSSAAGEAYWSCQAIAGATLYMSDIFAAAADRRTITAAFFHRLNSKYGFQGVATCSMYVKTPDTLKRLKANNERTVDFYHQGGRTVVETGWRY